MKVKNFILTVWAYMAIVNVSFSQGDTSKKMSVEDSLYNVKIINKIKKTLDKTNDIDKEDISTKVSVEDSLLMVEFTTQLEDVLKKTNDAYDSMYLFLLDDTASPQTKKVWCKNIKATSKRIRYEFNLIVQSDVFLALEAKYPCRKTELDVFLQSETVCASEQMYHLYIKKEWVDGSINNGVERTYWSTRSWCDK